MSSGSSDPPDVPSAGENFAESINTLLERGGELRTLDFLDALGQVDMLRRLAPAMANVSLGFESEFGPLLRAQQSEATRQSRMGDIYNAANLLPGIRAVEAQANPYGTQMLDILGQQTLGELQQGASLDPDLRREIEQAIRQGQTARGITRGSAPVAAEAFAVGSRAEQLRRNRQQAAANFLGIQQGAQINPFAFAGTQQVQQAVPTMPANGSSMNSLPSLFGATTDANNMNAQLGFNYDQMNQGGGIGGAAMGGLMGGLGGASAAGGLAAAGLATPLAPLILGGVALGALGGGL